MTWSTAQLEGLCTKIGSGATPRGGNKSYKRSGIALVRSMNVHMGRFKPDDLAFIDESQAAKLNNVVLEPDDVLLNITGASVARSCTLDNSVLPARVNQHVCILRSEPNKLNYRYLMRFLTSEQAQRELLRIAGAGATREAITKAEIQKFPIPLPPLAEQKRIAGILDAADALRAMRRESLVQLDTLLQSTFLDMFGDPVTNPIGREELAESSSADWTRCPLGDQITLQRGKDITKKAARPGDIPVISSGGVSFFHDEPLVSGPGVLLGRKGSVGRVHFSSVDFWPHDTTLYVKDFKGNVPRYVYHFFRQFPISHYEASAANPSLNRNNLHPVEILWPPLDLQRRFAAIVESVEHQKIRERAYMTELDILFASLQSRAFRGDL